MKKLSQIPQIRVKGFTQEWTKHLLNYYLETSQEKNFDGLYQREDVLSVSGDYGIVNQIEFQGRSFAGASVLNYGVVHTGDVVYTKSPLKENPYGIIKTNTGKAGVVSTLYAVYHPREVTYPEFVQWYFENNDRLNHYLNPLVNKGAKNDMKVSSDNALLGMVVFPDYAEQKAISDSFTHIKNIVLQCESRLKKLQTLKTSMLEKMFPKDGAAVPEIRFKGFDEKWSTIELAQIADKVNEKNVQNYITETFTNSAEHGIISQRDFFDHDIAKAEKINGYYIVEDNDFVYNPRVSVTAPCGPINCNRLGRTGVMSPLYTVFRTHDIDTLFLEWYFKSSHWYAYMRFNGDSGARSDRFSIKSDLFFKMPIPIPSMEEQHKIGQALQTLNENINLNLQELDKLQSIKKALLEKMFV